MSSKRRISGFIGEIEIFSPDIKSVNSVTGERAAFTASRTMVSSSRAISDKCMVMRPYDNFQLGGR